MAQTKKNDLSVVEKKLSLVLILSILSLSISLFTLFGTIVYKNDQHAASITASQADIDQRVKIDRYELCYNNDIKPCTTDTINAFYDKNS